MSDSPPQRIHLVSFGVENVATSRLFYVEGMGFKVGADVGTVVFLQAGHSLVLGLISRSDLQDDVGEPLMPGAGSFSLSHNVDTDQEVDELVRRAVEAGGRVVKQPTRADWGGYSGYFADPDGYRWEVASGGIAFDADGRLTGE